jgi:hypothetical protein
MERSYRTGFSLTSTRELPVPMEDSQSLLHLPAVVITEASNITVALVGAAKSQQEIKL